MAVLCPAGTTLAMNSTLIAQIRSISHSGIDGTMIDVTILATSTMWRDKKRGRADGGQVTVNLFYDPADTSHRAIFSRMDDGTSATYQIDYAGGGTTRSFGAFVQSMSETIEEDEGITHDVVLEIAGDPGFST